MDDVIVRRRQNAGRPRELIEHRKRRIESFRAVVPHTHIHRRAAPDAIHVVGIDAQPSTVGTAVVRQLRVAERRASGQAVRRNRVVGSEQVRCPGRDVLNAKIEIVAAAEELVGVARELHLTAGSIRSPLVPTGNPTRDVAGVRIDVPGHDRRLVQVRPIGAHPPESGVSRFEHHLRREDAGVDDVRRRIVTATLSRGARRGELRHGAAADPVVVVVPVHHTMIRRDVVVELPEPAARRRLARVVRIHARLRVGVALPAERSEEPELVHDERAGRLERDVLERREVIRPSAIEVRVRVPADQRIVLVVVVEIAVKDVAPLSRDHVEHRALHAAELGGGAELQHLHFVEDVGVQPGKRTDVRAVDQILILVGARPERGRGRRRAAIRRLTDAGS